MASQEEILNQIATEFSDLLVHVDGYEKINAIGRGGYAEVWRAKDVWTKKVVAIKILNGELDGQQIRYFAREIKTMQKAKHMFVLKILGFSVDSRLSIVSEYMENGSLYSFLRDETRQRLLNPTHRTLITMAVASAMAELHAQGIIHRDLKSLNILLDEHYLPRLGDFGIARFNDENPVTMRLGTPNWMAPEMFRGDGYDEKVDVYAFAILLYELLTNVIPWYRTEAMAIIRAVLENSRPEIPKTTPPALVKLIERCWDREPGQRPEFQEIYEQFADGSIAFDGTDPDAVEDLADKLTEHRKRMNRKREKKAAKSKRRASNTGESEPLPGEQDGNSDRKTEEHKKSDVGDTSKETKKSPPKDRRGKVYNVEEEDGVEVRRVSHGIARRKGLDKDALIEKPRARSHLERSSPGRKGSSERKRECRRGDSDAKSRQKGYSTDTCTESDDGVDKETCRERRCRAKEKARLPVNDDVVPSDEGYSSPRKSKKAERNVESDDMTNGWTGNELNGAVQFDLGVHLGVSQRPKRLPRRCPAIRTVPPKRSDRSEKIRHADSSTSWDFGGANEVRTGPPAGEYDLTGKGRPDALTGLFENLDSSSNPQFRKYLRRAISRVEDAQIDDLVILLIGHIKNEKNTDIVVYVLGELRRLIQNKSAASAFLLNEGHFILPFSRARLVDECFDVMFTIFRTVPELLTDDFAGEMAELVVMSPQKSLTLLSMYAESFESIPDSFAILDVLISDSTKFFAVKLGAELMSILYYLCTSFDAYRARRADSCCEIFAMGLNSRDSKTISCAYRALYFYCNRKVQLNPDHIEAHLGNLHVLDSALSFLVKLRHVPVTPAAVTRLIELGFKDVRASVILMKLASKVDHATAIAEDCRWIGTHFPTRTHSLQLFLLILQRPDLRKKLRKSEQTSRLMSHLCHHSTTLKIASLRAIVQNIGVSRPFITSLVNSGTMKSIMELASTFRDRSARRDLIQVLIKFADVSFSPDYILMTDVLRSAVDHSSMSSLAITAASLLSRYPPCLQRLVALDFTDIFRNLESDRIHGDDARIFLQNLSISNSCKQ